MINGFYFGHIFIHSIWLGLLLGGLAGSIVIKKEMKYSIEKNFFIDLYWNGILIWLFVYKFANVLFSPSELINHFSQLIFSAPHPDSWILAWIFTFFYVVFKAIRKHVSILVLFDVFGPALLLWLGIFAFFNFQLGIQTTLPWGFSIGALKYHPLNIYRGLLLCIGYLIAQYNYLGKSLTGNTAFLTVGSLGLSFLIPTLFQIQVVIFLGLSAEQWMYVIMIFTGILGLSYRTLNS